MPRKRRAPGERERLIEIVRKHLRSRGLARLQMAVIVAATGLSGFLISAALVHLGVDSMGLRYALAFLIAYGVFLGLVRLWVELYRRRMDGAADALDYVPDVFDGIATASGPSLEGGGGGDFAGGGATGDWTGPGAASVGSPGKSGGGGIGDALDLDEGWVIVVPIVIAIGSLVAAFILIWSAPGLLAELAIDVLVVSSLYRRLEHLDRRNWLLTALRKTWIPAAVVGALLIAGGVILDVVVPEARTMGDLFR